MATIKVNGIEVEGKLSASTRQDIDNDPNVVENTGVLKTEEYFEDISKIETDRYKMTGIAVYAEHYGTDNDEIIYEFLIDEITVKR